MLLNLSLIHIFSFDIVEELGGEEGFRELQAYANDNGVVLYPDFDYARAYKDTWFDGFDSSTDLSRTIDDRMAGYRIYDPIWQGFIEMGTGVISPNVMETMYDKLYKEYEPVSYTHLDVYKRQHITSAAFSRTARMRMCRSR